MLNFDWSEHGLILIWFVYADYVKMRAAFYFLTIHHYKIKVNLIKLTCINRLGWSDRGHIKGPPPSPVHASAPFYN